MNLRIFLAVGAYAPYAPFGCASVSMFPVCEQLTYYNAQRNNFYEVVVTSGDRRSTRIIATCKTSQSYINGTASSALANYTYRSCYTGAVARLFTGDVVSISNSYAGSIVSTVSADTFIGFIQLSPDH